MDAANMAVAHLVLIHIHSIRLWIYSFFMVFLAIIHIDVRFYVQPTNTKDAGYLFEYQARPFETL